MLVEMQQMASRPFAAVCVEIENKTDKPDKPAAEKKDLPVIRRRKNVSWVECYSQKNLY